MERQAPVDLYQGRGLDTVGVCQGEGCSQGGDLGRAWAEVLGEHTYQSCCLAGGREILLPDVVHCLTQENWKTGDDVEVFCLPFIPLQNVFRLLSAPSVSHVSGIAAVRDLVVVVHIVVVVIVVVVIIIVVNVRDDVGYGGGGDDHKGEEPCDGEDALLLLHTDGGRSDHLVLVLLPLVTAQEAGLYPVHAHNQDHQPLQKQ